MLRDLSLVQVFLAVAGIGFLIAFHELGHYAVARLLGMRVLRYSLGFGPRLFGVFRGGIDYQVAALPFGGFVQIAGMSSLDEAAKDDPRSFLNAPRWKRWLVLAAGPGFNYIAAFFLFFVFFQAWPSPTEAPTLELVEVHDGAARDAGIAAGEFVTHVNGDPVVGDAEFRAAIAASNGNPVRLTVLTPGSGAVRDVDVTPRVVEGGLRLGVSPAIRWPSAGILATAAAAAVNCLGESERTLMALAALVRREPGVDVGGPVAIVADMKDKIALGYRYYVRILASLSVSLGLFNLLPVPGLDGIKMVWLTIEGVVRRNINLKMQEVVNAIGVVLLLVLMLGLTVRDGMRLFG